MESKSIAAPHAQPLRFKTYFANVVLDALHYLGYQQVPEDSAEWDLFWTDKGWVREEYSSRIVPDNAKVCHFGNHFELTRKDQLAKNLKKFRRKLEREEGKAAAAVCGFMPETFSLPVEQAIFVEAFKRAPKATWIMKPAGSAQGKGIFLTSKLSEVLAYAKDTRFLSAEEKERQQSDAKPSYIVQQYIEDPYLIGGKKFDLRLYVLVTSYQPLQCWFYREGFARFSAMAYDKTDLSNPTIHLTNVAIQKQAEGYDESKGCKWLLSQVKRYLIARHGRAAVEATFRAIDDLFLTCLRAVQPTMIPDKHCFELYGFDVLLDCNLKPWLMEVNGSPSLTADTPVDYTLKHGLLVDTFHVADLERRRSGKETRIGGFDLVWDDGPVCAAPALPGQTQQRLNSALGCDMSDRAEMLAEAIDPRARFLIA